MTEPKVQTLFHRGVGAAGHYRIPALLTTKNGVLLACCDARYDSACDNPNRIDKILRRSTDSGETWEEPILAVEEQGTSKMKSSAAIDPALLCDDETGRVYLLYCHTPAGVGIRNCKSTVGEDEEGNRFLVKGWRRYVQKGAAVVTPAGAPTPFTVEGNGAVLKNGQSYGNLFTGGPLKEAPTSYLMLCHSDDDGKTWSKPVSLNRQVKTAEMGFIGPGPGVGICLKRGVHKGRLVFPIYYSTRKSPPRLSCAVIYSDDHGTTWSMGSSPNNTRLIGGVKKSDRTVKEKENLTESQVIELEDGRLRCFMRNHDPRRRTAVALSSNGGESFTNFTWEDSLPQPICQMSVIKLWGLSKPYVVFVNPASERERENGTVRLSEDDGASFPYARLFKAGDFIYSSCAQLPDGTIGILYEGENACEAIEFIKFPLDWIKNKTQE